ncbi:type II toxin-antitoxin system RelE/ParE family toxin [Streptococcus suis]|nr:type II toxin-antitoxin system RelE/ParE family toxin [Streptococcus suis]
MIRESVGRLLGGLISIWWMWIFHILLERNLAGYVRFRVGNYRIIAFVDEGELVLLNLHVGHRSDIYKKLK